jgi:hypothetical protein
VSATFPELEIAVFVYGIIPDIGPNITLALTKGRKVAGRSHS